MAPPEQPKQIAKVWLSPDQLSVLRQIAREQHENVSHLIRQAVAQFVADYLITTGKAPKIAPATRRATGRRPREQEELDRTA